MVPQPGLDGGYPSQVLMVEGVPRPGLDGEVPQPGLDGGGGTLARSGWWGATPSQVWMVGWGVPWPGLDGGGLPPARSGWWGGGYPSP